MASKSVAHGMGTLFKDCEHPQSRWSKCPHEYKIRYRSTAGKQTEESEPEAEHPGVGPLTIGGRSRASSCAEPTG